MKSNFEKESLCEANFLDAGECWHLWTDENHPLIFSSNNEFSDGMSVMGISARLSSNVHILTYELMSNHIHIVAAGSEGSVKDLFRIFKRLLDNCLNGGRYNCATARERKAIDLSRFEGRTRKLESLQDVRNVIAYCNRNGYLVSPDESPFSYPWGANRYFFNHEAKELAGISAQYQTIRERQAIIHSRIADKINPLKTVHGYACPLDFCAIEEGERMFQGAAQYFHIISRSIETYKSIAKEISECIFYTDDELYSAICTAAKDRYNSLISNLDKNAKVDLAKMMHFDYNAGNKQIVRILRLPADFVNRLFPEIF